MCFHQLPEFAPDIVPGVVLPQDVEEVRGDRKTVFRPEYLRISLGHEKGN